MIQRNESVCATINLQQQDYDEDDIYGSYDKNSQPRNQSCLPFARSDAYCHTIISRHREQYNALTAFVDLSQVYGSDKTISEALRNKDLGKGRFQENKKNGIFQLGGLLRES